MPDVIGRGRLEARLAQWPTWRLDGCTKWRNGDPFGEALRKEIMVSRGVIFSRVVYRRLAIAIICRALSVIGKDIKWHYQSEARRYSRSSTSPTKSNHLDSEKNIRHERTRPSRVNAGTQTMVGPLKQLIRARYHWAQAQAFRGESAETSSSSWPANISGAAAETAASPLSRNA